jgi:hypothetical protein
VFEHEPAVRPVVPDGVLGGAPGRRHDHAAR